MTTTLRAVVAGGLVALSVLAANPTTAVAQTQTQTQTQTQPTPPPPTAVFGAWQLRCGKMTAESPESCILIQDLIDQNTQRPLMQIAVGHLGQQRRPGAVITLPLGIRLPPGLEISVDGGILGNVAFRQCSPPPVNGCQATMVLDDNVLGRFKAGNMATVVFSDSYGRAIEIPFSLSGFTAGYAEVH